MKRHHFGFLLAALLIPVGYRVHTWDTRNPPEYAAVDVEEGKMLFSHEWTVKDPLTKGDGIGPVFNAKSCVECHTQGGVGGGGGLAHNVTTYRTADGRTGVLHSHAISVEFLETMDQLDSALPKTSTPTLEFVNSPAIRAGRGSALFSQRNTPALFGTGLIDGIPDRVIVALARKQQTLASMAKQGDAAYPVGRILYTPDGRVGKFGWKAQTATLLDFVQGACANELGLSNPNQPQPQSIAKSDYAAVGLDLTLEQCNQMAAFIAAMPKPIEQIPANPEEADQLHRGKAAFNNVGCAACHVANVGSVQGVYSDFLLHRMGKELEASGHYYAPPVAGSAETVPQTDEWRTPPLWGVADSGPYMHDGRATTLEQAIGMHGGQATASVERFNRLDASDRADLVRFLKSLRAPQ